MITALFILFIYLITIYQVIKVAYTGWHVLFPNFRLADEKLLRGSKALNTWWGRMLYYIFLISHFFIIACFIYAIIRFIITTH